MIAYSGFVPEDLPDKVFEAGFDRFLEMPYSLDAMHEAICESLIRRGHTDVAGYAAHCFSVFEMTHPKAADK